MYYEKGMTVRVNKDIERCLGYESYKKEGEEYIRRRGIVGLYAKEGEVGIIVKIFRPIGTGGFEIKPHSAKVKIGDKIKTFRLTSLDIIK